jgi:membrane-bound ClpP family serine protease
MMLVAIFMGMVDIYPAPPRLPGSFQIRIPVGQITRNLILGLGGACVGIWVLGYFLPRTNAYDRLISPTASGETSVTSQLREQASQLGQVGVALSVLRPGGKAQFGDAIVDVISQGEMIPKGSRVRIVGHSSTEAIVESVA